MPFNGQAAPVKMVTLTLQIPAVAMATLEKAAEKKGFKPSHYAQMLFDAAFAVRVGIDKRQTPLDRELDEQVRLVFAHAGQGTPAAIGRAIGMPADRVERILAAWQHAAGGKAVSSNTPERPSINDESSPEAGPQAEASLAGTGTGTLAGREGRREGEAASADLPTNAVERRMSEGSSQDEAEDAGVTSSGGENPAPIPAPKPKAKPKPAPVAVRPDAPSAPPPPKAKDLPAGRFIIGDLTERQSTVFAQAVKRINAGESVRTDDIANATGLKWHDVSSALKTLMGRALLARSAGTYVITSRGAELVASHLLFNQQAA